ncbi:MAG: TrmB family transcriptional regulator [Nitrososphaerota archaeon]|nr:TrmB family transcriptional regulator [Nitrososphaerota archaeon]MDG6954011.1 TrmB family transcriptional regulator [Nitrososphaerota archaeon]MDG6963613.1 TrmB family transcriptional regulator [Nitrososphaerota archaeon]MDG6968703.1 TrmB family transcriptional regulator [Nitrososphaerota archaeon]MDG6975258.1 TrmB family transcriptional regulator [Nitrososphaerota archaeon]
MTLSERASGSLEELGLTGSEVKAYVALLKGGTMTASDVSREARIPYSKVYDALESLHRRGWVEEQKSRPIVYTAKPPDTALEELRARQETERKEREQTALEELMGIYVSRGEQEKPDIWIMRGTNEILSRVKNLLLNCRAELLIALPSQLAPFIDRIEPLLATLREKGVKCLILTSPDLPHGAADQLAKHAEVRSRKTMYGGGLVSDSREVVLLLGSGEQGGLPLAIWASHHGLASFAKDYFEFLWSSPGTSNH